MFRPSLSPALRSALIEAFTFHAPQRLKRATSTRFGLPLRPEVRAAGIVFIHVPKNAGTTISTQLYGGHIGHRAARFYRACDPAFFASHPSFAISRDPVSRFRSAFHYARAGGSPDVPASDAVRRFAQGFDSALECARVIADLGPERRDRLDPVFRSQMHYVGDGAGQVLVDRVFRLEDLQGEFDFARHHFSLAEKRNAGGASARAEEDPELGLAVAKAYPEDFELLGYRP